jgi:hypothetical protein
MFVQALLDRITRRQYGLITRSQALSCGLTAAMIRTRLERGEWLEMRPSVYAVAGAPQSREQALLAVLLAHGATSLASHGTATHHWRLKNCEQPDRIEVVSSLASGVRLDGVRGHRSGSLFDSDCTASRGIPIVTAERSLIDISGRLSQRELGTILDDAIRRKLVDLEALRRCAQRLTPAPGRSMSRVRRVLQERLPGYSPGESDLETRALRALVAAGLPPPRQQYHITLRGKKARIDLAYPEQKVAIELDSWEFHGNGNRTAFDVDKARSNDLLVIGWSPTAFTSTMTDEYLVYVVTELLRRARLPGLEHQRAI